MLRIILCAFIFLQVAHGWGWYKPCRTMEHTNCDGYALTDSYYYRDGNRDHHGDYHNHHNNHGSDNDRFHNHHGGGSWGSGWHHDNWNGNKKMCGSDGVTYTNRCYFMKAHCKQKSIELRHEGACTAADTTAGPVKTTPEPVKTTPEPLKTTPKAITDDFCKHLQSTACHGVNPICGTNGQSYDNECEFEKAKCFDVSIHVKHLGTC